MVRQFTDSVKKYPIVWYYVISVLIVILIIPVFLLTGADVAVERSLQKTGIQFNTDLVMPMLVVTIFLIQQTKGKLGMISANSSLPKV